MNWKCKALLQHAFSLVPSGVELNYLCQRHVTKNLPMSDKEFASRVAGAWAHVEMLNSCGGKPIEEASFYEFGAGWDLIPPLSFWAFGVQRQLLVDIRHLLKPDLVNETIRKFQRVPLDDLSLVRRPEQLLEAGKDPLQQLREYYGIEYRAPCDARCTGLDAGSIDYITSTNTLEHIPPDDIEAILRECHRLLNDEGVISSRIDYQDHYSYFDPSVSVYNYLQFSDRAWSRYNTSLNYQNRLRHRDYLELFARAGFEVVEERPKYGTTADLATLQQLTLDSRYRDYTPTELAIRGAKLSLRKRRPG